MPIDPYSPCPGGTGKKIKFCCSDLTAELDKLERMIEGEQRAAALELIEGLEAKYPDRACLLSSKAMLAAELGLNDKAAKTVEQFRAKYPDNPVALAEAAILRAAEDAPGAVELLQRGLENVDQQLPLQAYDALGPVAMALLGEGEILAARAHWMLQIGFSGGKDEQAMRLLMQLQGSGDVPLLLKEDWALVDAPADALWKHTFAEAMQQARLGRWRKAAEELADLAAKAGSWPEIARNLAILQSWLARRATAVAWWHTYAAAEGVPLEDAVEAEATAQLLDPSAADVVDLLMVAYPIVDFEALLAQLGVQKQVLRMPTDLNSLARENEPPPKGYYSLLDRPKPAEGTPLTLETVPHMVAQVLIYGKQTDREARLELLVTRPELATAQAALRTVAGSAIGEPQAEQVSAQISAVEQTLGLNWFLPDDMPQSERRPLLAAGQRQRLLKRWTELPQRVLDGQAPRQVAGDAKYRVKLLAAILNLDLGGDAQSEFDFNELRRELGLPTADPIDPTEHSIMTLPLVRVARLQVEKLSDHDLLVAYDRAQQSRFLRAVKRLGREIVRRDSLDKELDKSAIYAMLAQLATELDEAAGYLDEARRIAAAAGKSSARFDLIELAVRMGQGDVRGADRLLAHIRDEHLREPGIAQALYSLLAQWGIVRPDGSMAGDPAAAPAAGMVVPGAAPAEAGSKIWTPGSDDAPAAGKKPTIWTPGM